MAWRLRRKLRPRYGRDGGFVLLLAFCGALLLLLSSLSIQTAALQSRASDVALRRRNQRSDLLSSAAQLVAGRLVRHPCLLGLPWAQWGTTGVACITPAELRMLSSGTLPAEDSAAGRYVIKGYQLASEPLPVPGQAGADLDLQWLPQQGPAVQRRFRLDLARSADGSEPLHLRGIRP